MGGKSKPWTSCNACGRWVFNWRLEKQKGRCECGRQLQAFKPSATQHNHQANYKSSDKLQLAGWLACLPVDLDPTIKTQIAELAAKGVSTDPKATDPWKRFQQARAAEQTKKQQAEKAAKLHAEAVQLVAERKESLEHAITECILAEQAAATALAEYNSSMGLEVGRAGESKAVKEDELLGFDPAMFAEADDYEEELATDLRKTESDLKELSKVLAAKKKEILHITESARKKMESAPKKRKGPDGQAQAAGSTSTPGSTQQDPNKDKAPNEEEERKEKAEFEKAFQERLAKEQQIAAEAVAKKKAAKSQYDNPTPAEAAKLVGTAARAKPGAASGVPRV